MPVSWRLLGCFLLGSFQLFACAEAEPRFVAPEAPVSGQALVLRAREATKVLPREAMSRSSHGLSRSETRDGIVKLSLAGRFQHAQVAVLDEHGQAQAACVDGPSAASDDAGAHEGHE